MPKFPSYDTSDEMKFRRPVPPELRRLSKKGGLQEGELTKHNYALRSPSRTRHSALEKSITEDGVATTFRRLVLLKTWNKRRPGLRRIVNSDINWLRRTHGEALHTSLVRQR